MKRKPAGKPKTLFAAIGLSLQLSDGKCVPARHCFRCGTVGWPVKEGLITHLTFYPGVVTQDAAVHNCWKRGQKRPKRAEQPQTWEVQ